MAMRPAMNIKTMNMDDSAAPSELACTSMVPIQRAGKKHKARRLSGFMARCRLVNDLLLGRDFFIFTPEQVEVSLLQDTIQGNSIGKTKINQLPGSWWVGHKKATTVQKDR